MKLTGINGFIYRICTLIMQFSYLQLLWICYTVLGLGVFGIFPATAAMFSVVRKWIMGESDIPVYQTFWKTYKNEFLKVNMLGLILTAIGWILYIDYHYFTFGESVVSSVIKIVTLIVTYFFITTCIYFFPVYVHYRYRLMDYIKFSFLYSLASPLKSAGIFIISSVIYYLFMKVPVVFIFFSGSAISYIWMWYVYTTIDRLRSNNKKGIVD
ncbi:YesL family protein [Neobacillus driksii]|uniref:YesL family protein n=1 Tax=Neobacillus driksii TaxID=3035913 RepID=UPI0027D81EB0|nr:YesL family protein [Neobacillus niacini]